MFCLPQERKGVYKIDEQQIASFFSKSFQKLCVLIHDTGGVTAWVYDGVHVTVYVNNDSYLRNGKFSDLYSREFFHGLIVVK